MCRQYQVSYSLGIDPMYSAKRVETIKADNAEQARNILLARLPDADQVVVRRDRRGQEPDVA